jgi:hypothetical protein
MKKSVDPAPKPVEQLSSTTKMPKVDLEEILRSESGTRAAVTRDEIARHVNERLSGALPKGTAPPALEASQDPHARPTLDVFPVLAPPRTEPEPETAKTDSLPRLGSEVNRSGRSPAPLDEVHAGRRRLGEGRAEVNVPTPGTSMTPPPVVRSSAPSAVRSPAPLSQFPRDAVPRWLLAAAIVSVVLLVSTTIALGFFLGRISGHH